MRNSLAAIAFVAAFMTTAATPSKAQTDDWNIILDASKFQDWAKLGESNWRVEDGVVGADKLAGPIPSFLVSKDKYRNFDLRVEFWSSDEANSGVFIRCGDPKMILDRNCYEVNVY